MRKHQSKRMLSALLVLALLLSFAVPVQATAQRSNELSFEQVDNSEVTASPLTNVAEDTAEEEPEYAPTDVVRVSIILEDESTVQAGYSVENIAQNAEALAYRADLEKKQASVTASIEKTVGAELDVAWNLTLAANLISAYVQYGQIEAIEAVAGVEKVIIEQQYEPAVLDEVGEANPNMATSMDQIGSAAAWAAGYTGAGTRIAIIDTGTDTDHQSFSNEAFLYSLKKQAEMKDMDADEYIESLNLLDVEEIASVAELLNVQPDVSQMFSNEKMPFNYNYIDGNYDVTHDNDSQGGHGSHVAGIATANAYIPDGNGGFTHALESVMVQGVAPDAQLITMKVFGKRGGAYESDYLAAVEDAVILGCDAINLSLGSSYAGYGRTFEAEYQQIMDSLVDAGAVLCAAAGNNGAWPQYWATMLSPTTSTVALRGLWLPNGQYLYAEDTGMAMHGSPGSYTNTLAVASVENAGLIGYYFKSGDDVIIYNNYQPSVYGMDNFFTLAGEQEYVLIDGLGTEEDWAAVGDALVGKIAICSRGTLSFVDKATNAVNAGAIGTIIYNNEPGVIGCDMTGYTKTNPTVSITQGQAKVIKGNSTPVTDANGNVLYYTGTIYVAEGSEAGAGSTFSEGSVMATSSSWGGAGTLLMKPEIAAPGGAIYSVNGMTGSYITMSGTSMASPQVAGMSALMMQYIRESGLEEKTGLTARQLTHSLLMSTSEPMVDSNSGVYYPILQQGSGLANVGAAVTADSYILMDENATASYADGKVKAELGDDPERTGKYEFSFTLYNMNEQDNVYALSAEFFAQDVFEDYANGDMNPEETALYMDYLCTMLSAEVTWTVDGQPLTPAEDTVKGMDFDGNRAVNVNDGQALLNYVTGVTDTISNLDKADVDGDGDVDTHDAYAFFKNFSTGMLFVPGNGQVKVTVSAQLTREQMDWLDANYVNGTYIQGYIFAESMASSEGVAGTTHSIPVLAFYGGWTEASMYDGQYLEYLYGENNGRVPYFSNGNGLLVQYPHDQNNLYYLTGNPVVADEVYMPERNAINSDTIVSGFAFTAIRNAASLRWLVKNETSGEVLIDYQENGLIIGPLVQSIWLTRVNLTLLSDTSIANAKENDVISIELDLAPEYYMDAEGNVNWDALGDGARMKNLATVDNTAPTLENVYIQQYGGNHLVVNAHDNQYIAGVALYNEQGFKCYDTVGAKADIQPGESAEYVLDLTEVINKAMTVGSSGEILLQVYDYAMNTATYRVDVSNLIKNADYSGLWLGFSDGGGTYTGLEGEPSVYGDGLYNRWFSFVPEKMYFSSPFNASQNGWFDDEYREDIARSEEVMVHRAAYVNGYVYIIGRDNYMYVSTINDLTNYQKVRYFGDEFKYSDVTGLAFNYADNQLYLMLRKNHSTGYYNTYEHINTVDMVTGELTEQYVLSNIYNPYKSSTNEYERLSGLAIDGEGNFYSLTSSWYYPESEFLYTWNNDMAVDGYIDGLKPINNSKDGYVYDKYDVGQGDELKVRGMYNHLTWDFENNELYGAIQWSESDNWEYNIMLKLDTKTGKGSKVSDYDGGKTYLETNLKGITTPITSLFGYATHTIIKIPSIEADLTMNNRHTPYGIELTQTEINSLRGASIDLDATVYPWTMVDKSLTWTTSDPSVATVDENGVVTLVGVGTATITATTVLTPSVSATCSVTSILPDVNVRGLATKTDGTYWAEFNPSYMPTLTNVSGATTAFKAGTQSGDKIYAHDGKNLYSIDPTTFTATKGAELSSDVIWRDASGINIMDKDYIFSLCMNGTGTYILDPATGEKVFDDFMGEESGLKADPGVAIDVILDEENSRPSRGRYSFYGYILSESGMLYEAEYDAMAFGDFVDFFPFGIDEVGNTGLKFTGNVSMKMDTESGYLLVTGTTESGTKLYAIDPENGNPADLGTFANVSSLVALYLMPDTEGDDQNNANSAAVSATARKTAAKEQPVAKPDSAVEIGNKETTVTLTVKAIDIWGKDVAATNGLATVNYDTTKLALTDVTVYGDYTAKVEADGTVTFGYVSLSGIAAGDAVATLTFDVLELEDSEIIIQQKQVNNDLGNEECLNVRFIHSNSELRNYREATCTEDGYTGDSYCLDCGMLLSEGEVIPATGHSFGDWYLTTEPGCTEKGEETRWCDNCDAFETREVEAYCPTANYTDVPLNQWYHDAVDYVVDNGLMNGMSETIFAPTANMTRAQLVTVLYRLAGEPSVEGLKNPFADVASDEWYTNAILWAADAGIVKGMTETIFAPSANVTREQLVTILYRFDGETEADTAVLDGYTDADTINGYAVDAFAWAVETGIITGMTETTLAPQGTATRAQIATILMRYCGE